MTATAKSSLTLTTSAIADGQAIDAADVLTPFTDTLNHVKNGKFSVSANDTYVKNLDDALLVTSPLVKAIGSGGGNETLGLTFDFSANAIDITVNSGEALAIRDFVVIDNFGSNQAYKVDSDNTSSIHLNNRIRGYALNTTSGSGQSVTVRIHGLITGFSSLTSGSDYWAGTTAGTVVSGKPYPSQGGAQLAIIWAGLAMSTTTIYFFNKPIRWVKRASLTNNSTLTISHGSEVNFYDRRISAQAIPSGTLFEPAVIGRWAGGTRDVAVQSGDGAGASEAAQTTFKNVSGGTLDLICCVEQD